MAHIKPKDNTYRKDDVEEIIKRLNEKFEKKSTHNKSRKSPRITR